MKNVVCVPIDESCYAAVQRFLDKKGIARSVSSVIHQFIDYGIDNAEWKAEVFFPEVEKESVDEGDAGYKWKHPDYRKAIFLPNGTQVRMEYPAGNQNFAIVERGQFKYMGENYNSPSQLASGIAGGTSRSAPRDLYIKRPNEIVWRQVLKIFQELDD